MLPVLSAVLALAGSVRASSSQNVLLDQTSELYTLNFSSPTPYIFSSLRSLLQQWPNTFFPNGHSIVPCEISPFTNLYHGRRDGELPASPEWFAFDAEMSYGIMGGTRNSHLLTYQTTKSVRCLYFDGMSAALMGRGQLDSQMAFIYGNTTGPPEDSRWRGLQDEYNRATGLCDWVESNGLGGSGGVEGFVRMNAGFELVWCNFSSPSVQLVSRLNVTAPPLPEGYWDDGAAVEDLVSHSGLDELGSRSSETTKSLPPLPSSTRNGDHSTPDPNPAIPPNWRNQRELEPFLLSQSFRWYRSATWHLGATSGLGSFPGENRVKLLTCGFATYYDPIFQQLQTKRRGNEAAFLNLTAKGEWKGPGANGNRTIALQKLTRRRRSHNLEDIDSQEASFMNTAILNSMRDFSDETCSGVDWVALASDISSRYSSPLSEFALLLSSRPNEATNATKTRLLIANARAKAHSMLMPFLEYPAQAFNNTRKPLKSNWTLESKVGQMTFGRCKYAYTRLLYDSSGRLHAHIKPPEILLVDSIEDVLDSICGTVISIAFEIEYTWLSNFNSANTTLCTTLPELDGAIGRWQSQLEELIAWLGWASDSVTCKRQCNADEFCFIPMWPLTTLGGHDGGHFPGRPPPRKGGPREPPKKGDPRKPPHGPPPRNDMFEQELWSPQCVKWDS